MNLKEKIKDMSEQEAALLLSQNGMLIKRPILVDDQNIYIGYQKETMKNRFLFLSLYFVMRRYLLY